MYIFQVDRFLLQKQIAEKIRYLKGKTLNIGSGQFERYELPTTVTEYVRMDIAAGENVDVVGRAEKLPFPDTCFDAIISTQVFEHVENPEQAATEVGRVLRKDGYLLITVPQWNELHEEPHDYWRYTRYGLVALFERHDLKLISIDQRGGYFSTRAQMAMRFYIDVFHLHNHPWGGRIASKIFALWGRLAIWRDRRDHSVANRKHTIGWCAVFQKK